MAEKEQVRENLADSLRHDFIPPELPHYTASNRLRKKFAVFEEGIGLGDISLQPAVLVPPIYACCLGVLGITSANLTRGFDRWSFSFVFPKGEVGLGDVAVAVLAIYVLARVVLRFASRGRVPKGTRKGRRYGASLWGGVFISFGLFGANIWGAAAGIATRRRSPSALPTTSWPPIASAMGATLIYHVVCWLLAVVLLSPLAAIIMLFFGGIGPVGCFANSFYCAGFVTGMSGFICSIFWVTGSGIFWLWVSDLGMGLHRIFTVRRTLRQIELGQIRYREPVSHSLPINVLHISDVHCVASERASRCESDGKKPFGNADILLRLKGLSKEMADCDVLVLSGDLTDTGDPAEWSALQLIIDDWPPELKQKAFVIPGNHDINFVTSPSNASHKRDTEQLHGRAMRQAQFALFVEQFVHSDDEFAILTRTNEIEMRPARQWFDEKRAEIEAYLKLIRAGESPTPPKLAYDWRVPVIIRKLRNGDCRYALIGMDTSNWGWTALSNALGSDYGRLHKLVTQCASTLAKDNILPIIVGHHAMVPIYERGNKVVGESMKEAAFVAGASQLYGDLWFDNLVHEVPAPGFVFLHGHRHVSRCIGTEVVLGRRAYLLGAPSILFGDEWDGVATKVASWHSIRLLGAGGSGARLSVRTTDLFGCPLQDDASSLIQ